MTRDEGSKEENDGLHSPVDPGGVRRPCRQTADPAGYREFASADDVVKGRCWTVPVLANGRIYVRGHDGHVACVDVTR